MKKHIKKMFNMEDKDPVAPEQEEQVATAETTEKAENKPENSAENEKIQELQRQLEESKSKYLYLFSDYETAKRHHAKERIELMQTAGRDILTALLPVLDDFDRADKNGAVSEGIKLIQHKLVHTLEQKGLKRLETKPGDPFNADLHEAVVEIPAPAEDLKGKIVDIIEPGYQLGDRIIRFTKVVVGN